MMTETALMFRDDAYVKSCAATVTRVSDHAVSLNQTIFYPLGGGQPGDTGSLTLADGSAMRVIDTRRGDQGAILHLLDHDVALPEVGTQVTASIDWDRRHAHMRMHTALHLLGVVLRFPVTGGSVGADRSRLDFDMQDSVDKDAVTESLNSLIDADYAVTTRWITDAELDAQPELVRTLSVQPPRGAGRVRLLEIGGIDLQPCGGTHVQRTGEIGRVRVSKVEKKGRQNRRVAIVFNP
jgi:misacylated tRNA(Ala) deacylase